MKSNYLNEDKVHVAKREKIRKCIEFVKEQNKKQVVIEKIILFGSAVTDDCDENSDIDLCFVTNYNCSNPVFFDIYGGISLVMDDLCDILIYHKLKGKIKEEIDAKGIVVYDYREG